MVSNIKLNYVYSLLNKLVFIISNLITLPYLSRVLGPEKIGIKRYVGSFSDLFVVLATFGIFTLAQREIARSRDSVKEYSRVFWNILLSATILIFLFLCLWLIIAFSVNKYQIYFIILSLSIIASFFDITWFYIGFESFGRILVRNLIIKLCTVFLIYFLVQTEQDILLYILIICVSEFCGNLSLWINFMRNYKIIDHSLHKYTPSFYIKESFKYYIPSTSLFLYVVVDKVMIGLITNNEYYNGIFEQASAVILIILTILNALNNVMSPRISYLFKNGFIDEINTKIKTSLNCILVLTYPAISGLVIVSDDIVNIFLGNKFGMSSKIICLMSPFLLIISISNIICLQYITPSGKLYLTNRIVCFGIICNILGNCLLIPIFGIEGAIYSSLFSELCILHLYVKKSSSVISWNLIFKLSYKRVIAAGLMAIIVLFFKLLFCNSYLLIVYIIIGIISYLCILVAFGDKLIINIANQYLFNKSTY